MAQLGSTLLAIAGEKAGIIKPGRPVISGVRGSDAANLIARIANDCESPLKTIDTDFAYRYIKRRAEDGQVMRASVLVSVNGGAWLDLPLPLLGEHQAANAAVAVASVSQLRHEGFLIPFEAVRDGLSNLRWPARLEIVSESPTIVLDCAHNVASIQAAVETIQESFVFSRRGLVFACSKDKDFSEMLARLVPHFHAAWFTQYSASTRCVQADELAALWQRCGGGYCESVRTPTQALKAAQDWAGPNDLICALGSTFLAGEIRSAMNLKF